MPKIYVKHLGQSGFRLELGRTVIYVDPYLSDSVERSSGSQFRRLKPAFLVPSTIADASAVLISHIHGDHCDLDTVVPVSAGSPQCQFLGPREVVQLLVTAGINSERTVVMNSDPFVINGDVAVYPIPAAHKDIEKDSEGCLRFLGYVISYGGKKLFHAGDSCVHDSIIAKLKEVGPIDVAFLPVNECNFYRDRVGIVGNMSVRDAFLMAEEVKVRRVVPMHYDMFALNQTYPEEIQIVYNNIKPSFLLDFEPKEI